MRAFLLAAAVILAPVLQSAVVNRLPGGGPDLTLIGVIALAPLVRHGAVLGFAAGLAADIAPPADHSLGRHALVFCLAGWVCGTAVTRADRAARSRAAAAVLVAAPVALGAVLLDALLAALLSDQPAGAVLARLPGALGWTVPAAPVASAVITLLARRLAHRIRSRRA